MNIRALGCCFLLVLLSTVLLHASHSLIELVLKDFDGLDGIFGNVLTQSAVELPHLIDVDIEALSSTNHASDPVSVLWEAHEPVGRFLHLKLLLIGAYACASTHCHVVC